MTPSGPVRHDGTACLESIGLRVYARMMPSPCFCTLLRSATRRVASAYDAALAPVGVNIAQFSLLRIIRRSAPVTLTELGRMADLDRSTIGRNVRVLQKLGMLTLGRGEDQREATVQLSAEGLAVLDRGAPLWDGVQDGLENKLGAAGASALRAVLNAF